METTMHRPKAGDSVWTADGHQFAYVKELHGDYFKLDVPMAQDYWFACAHIADVAEGRVTLRFDKGEVDDHKLSEPGVDTQRAEGVIGSEEMLNQRERMERELEAQRARMRSGN
ncbi:MAG TPA: hypothetical protein PJ994_06710 [Tepidiformaceae bacterium]|nr:hypothetical protein [Tepidiformaceae bacterium]